MDINDSVLADAHDEVRTILRTYLDAVALAEPLHEQLWESHGVTIPEVRALRRLRSFGPLATGRLADEVGLTATATTRLVDKLERQGFVVREQSHQDRRSFLIRLLDKGEDLVAETSLLDRSNLRRVVEAMSPEDRTAVLDGLRVLVERAQQYLDAADPGAEERVGKGKPNRAEPTNEDRS